MFENENKHKTDLSKTETMKMMMAEQSHRSAVNVRKLAVLAGKHDEAIGPIIQIRDKM